MTRITDREARRQDEQGRLDSLKSAEERNELGQFATPPVLALEIARYAWSLSRRRTEKLRFVDPGIGTGAFYSALRQVFPEDRIESAAGVEIDPHVVKATRALWRGTGLRVTEGDFTTQPPPLPEQRSSLILTNPPYVRHHHLGRDEKLRLQSAVARSLGIRVSGLSGLYCYFLLLAHQWLADRGLAIWLIPSEFMDVNYGAAIRDYLTNHVTLLHIHRFCPEDTQFADALVSSAVVVYEKSAPPGDHRVQFSFGGTLQNPHTVETVSLVRLQQERRKWSHYPRAAGNGILTTRRSLTLGDLFSVKRGIATGANGFFILPRDEALARGIPLALLRPILPSPRHVLDSVIEADDDGYPKIQKILALINCGLTEDEVRRKHPSLWSYLLEGKKEGIHERYLTRSRSPWFSQEHREPAPFLCTYMGRNRERPFRFFWNKSRAIAANVYLLLYPRSSLATVLKSRPGLYVEVLERLQNLATENFLGEGRVYGGGLYKMEPKELGRLSAESLADLLGGLEPQGQRELQFA